MMLDSDPARARRAPIPGLTKGAHDAVFGADGAIWYLAPVKDRDQLHRMTLGGTPVADVRLRRRHFGLQGQRRPQPRDRLGRHPRLPRHRLRRHHLSPPKPEGSARVYDQMFVRHWDTWSEPGVKSRIFSYPIVGGKLTGMGTRVTGPLVGDTPVQAVRRRGGDRHLSADGKTVYFALREAGRIEPTSTNLDIFMAPADGSAAPVNLTAPNGGTDTLPTLVTRRPHPGLCLDGPRRLRGRPPGDHAARSRHGPHPRADRRLGPLGRLARVEQGRPQPADHRRGCDGSPRLAGRRRQRARSPA